MSKKWFLSGVVAAVVLVLAACAPVAGNPGAGGVVSVTRTNPNGSIPAGAGQTAIGQSGAGAPAGSVTSSGGVVTGPGQSQPGTGGVVYTDATYKFSVTIPSDFVLRTRTAEQLAQWNPKAVAGILIMNPDTANSQVPDEPGDLEVRVYDLAGATSLDGWLKAAGLTASSNTNSGGNSGSDLMYRISNGSGAKVCRSTMIAPQCSYFFMGNAWVYQLISMTQAGDSMLATFTIVQ